MARKVSKNLNAEQRVLISNDPAYWSARFVESQLHRQSYVEVPAGSSKRVDHAAVRGGLIDAYQGQIPAEVWSTLGIQPPSWSEPEVVEFVEPLAARLAIVIDGYRVSVTERNAIIRDDISRGRLTIEELLARPAQIRETYLIFNEIKWVRDEVLQMLGDSHVEPKLQPSQRLQLAEDRNLSISDRIWSGKIELRFPKAATRSSTPREVETAIAEDRPTDLDSRPFDQLITMAAQLSNDLTRVNDIEAGKDLSPDASSRLFPDGTDTMSRLAALREALPDDIRDGIDKRLSNDVVKGSEPNGSKPSKFYVDVEADKAKAEAISAVGLAAAIPGTVNLLIPGFLIPGSSAQVVASLDSLNPSIALEHMTQSASQVLPEIAEFVAGNVGIAAVLEPIAVVVAPAFLATVAVLSAKDAVKEISRGIRQGSIGRGRKQSLEIRQQYVEATLEHGHEVEQALAYKTEINRQLEQVNANVLTHTLRDHSLLVTGQLTGTAADRAQTLLDTIGPPPEAARDRKRYSSIVVAVEKAWQASPGTDRNFPSNDEITKLLRGYKRVRSLNGTLPSHPEISEPRTVGMERQIVRMPKHNTPPLELG